MSTWLFDLDLDRTLIIIIVTKNRDHKGTIKFADPRMPKVVKKKKKQHFASYGPMQSEHFKASSPEQYSGHV